MSHKIVMIGEKKFALPFLDLIPIAPDDKAALRASIKAKGILEKVVAWKEGSTNSIIFVIDGANRVMIAAELELKEKIRIKVPVRKISAIDENEAKLQCRILNLHRRHLTRNERQIYIDQLLKDHPDWSNRTIAKETGASPQTVGRRRGAGGKSKRRAKGTSPASGNGQTDTSQDDKYDDSQEKQSNARSNGARDNSEKSPAETPKDHFGNDIPARCRDAYCDPFIQETIDFLAEWGEKFRKQFIANQMAKLKQHYPFINAQDVIDACGMISNHVTQVLEHFKQKRPAGVCPECNGKGCAACNLAGMVPRDLYLLKLDAQRSQ